MIPPTIFAGALIAQGAFFAALLVWLHAVHLRERDALLNRLMARDLSEYQAVASPGPAKPQLPHNMIARKRELDRRAASNDD